METAQRTTSESGKKRTRIGRHVIRIINYTIVGLLIGLTLFILVWVIASSFKTTQEIFKSPFELPKSAGSAATRNYGKAWNVSHMGLYFRNSLMVVFTSAIMLLVVSSPAAYVLARIRFRGSTLINYYFVAGMGVPLQLILVPYYVLMSGLRLTNSLQGLMVTYMTIQLPLSILLLIAFFKTLPSELEDSGAIDGCGNIQIFIRIILPLASPGLVTTAIFNFVWIWKDFLMAFLLINKDKARTLAMGLLNVNYSMQYTGDWASMFAALVIMIIPVTIVYMAITRRVISGLTLGMGK